MNLIPISSILIPATRQRQEFPAEALMELTMSIHNNTLLHAPVLRSTPEGMMLVAGERRLRAIKDLWILGLRLVYNGEVIPEGQVPYIDLGELGELEAEEAELDENLKRQDLSWQELAAAHQRLHKLRQKQAMVSPPVGGENNTRQPWTVADTAKELVGRSDGGYQDKVRRELIVAKHLDKPEVQAAKSVDEAYKILAREEVRRKNVEMAEAIGQSFRADVHQLFNQDCIEWMEDYLAIPEAPLFDVILTDPPYGMGADQFGDGAGKLVGITHEYKDDYQSWFRLMSAWCPLTFAITKSQAHAYVFCDIDRFHDLKDLMAEAGWYVFRTPFIYIKPNSGRVPLPDQGPRRQWEAILYAIKGKKPVTHIYPDVLYSVADEQLAHGAQKTVEGFKNLLQRSVRPGDLVLDCFAGTGPIIPAAHAHHCRAYVIEQSKEYFAICVERVKQLEEEG